jgi:hypothetical protein
MFFSKAPRVVASTSPSPLPQNVGAAPSAQQSQTVVGPEADAGLPKEPPAPPAKKSRWVIRQTAMQGPMERRRRPGDTGAGGTDELLEYPIQLEVPGYEKLFLLQNEADLHERMRQEAKDRNTERISFPEEEPLTKEKYRGRTFAKAVALVEPNYTCYQRLYFEDLNSERYGWDFGFLQPLVSTGIFYWDLALLPYHLGTRPCQKYECSAGYCLPGDPVPYLIYPPELSLTGAVAEGSTIATLFAIFP